MRVIAGRLGGRNFNAPSGHRTHPMSEKIRGALFSSLGDVSGLTVLDAFSGTGAVGFEALSRGAKSAQLVELDKAAYLTIKENIQSLGVGNSIDVVRANIKGWSGSNSERQFDIVVCDPPYDAVLETLIIKISRHVKLTGILVLSWPSDDRLPRLPDMEVTRNKKYGNATLVFYQKNG